MKENEMAEGSGAGVSQDQGGKRRDGFKLDVEHIEDCHAAHDEDGITFVVYDGADFGRDRIGRKQGSTMWHRFRCNDTRCPAVLLIRWDVLAAFVNQVDEDWFDVSR